MRSPCKSLFAGHVRRELEHAPARVKEANAKMAESCSGIYIKKCVFFLPLTALSLLPTICFATNAAILDLCSSQQSNENSAQQQPLQQEERPDGKLSGSKQAPRARRCFRLEYNKSMRFSKASKRNTQKQNVVQRRRKRELDKNYMLSLLSRTENTKNAVKKMSR